MKHLLAIAITLLQSAALAEQFTPEQMLEVMTKSPENRDVRVGDKSDPENPNQFQCAGLASWQGQAQCWGQLPGDDWESSLGENAGINAQMRAN